MKHFSIAAAALALSTVSAAAVTVNGQLSAGGMYSVSSAPIMMGDTVSVMSGMAFGTDDFVDSAGLTTFDLVTSTDAGSNVGTMFDFGDFTFTISSTEMAQIDGTGLEVFGLGTVAGSGFEATPSSFRFTVAGAGISTSTRGFYSLFVESPYIEDTPPVVPLPAGLPLLLGGIAAFGLARRKV